MFDGNGVLVNFLDTQIALVEADEGIVFYSPRFDCLRAAIDR